MLADALRAEADAWQATRLGTAGAFPSAIARSLEADGALPELDPQRLRHCEPAADGHPYSLVTFEGPKEVSRQ